ncbi:TonB-dependent siderophore receptor [Acinetobacter sp. B5B]|uniref:TonB-dependent receptor n=1 Tax=Acinetobacter baretiae TaxID=2605383 RepID=UPI0018C343E3|nr:TonB-dependent siderophore receptor [Acinetobacter baretiae]MBF7681943.1 TonB-dependent siderophore receptor [Acinetobacter baretiae]
MKKTILLVSILSSFSGLGYADEVAALPSIRSKANQQTLKQEVTQASTATKGALQLKDVPQTVNVIPQEILREQAVTSVQGALQNVPGVGFSTGDGQRDQVSIRGFNSVYDSYIDGFRDDAMYYRDLSNTERIEVVKGPASVLYGRGSAGGLINRITKKPMAEPLREITLMGSTLGQRRSQFDVNQPLSDQVKMRLTGAVEDSDGYRNQAFLKRQAIAPSMSWDISDKTKLLVQADYLHDDRLADQGFPMDPTTHRPLALDRKVFLGPANAKDSADTDTEVKSATVTLDHTFDNAWKYHGVVHAYKYSLDRQLPNSSYNAKNQTISITPSRRFRNEKGVATQQELSGQFKTGSIEHNVLVGLELNHQNKDDKIFASPPASTLQLNNIVLPTWQSISTVTPTTNNKNNSTNKALYIQDMLALNTQLKVLIGARYDDLEQKRSSLAVQKNVTTPYNRTDHKFSPRVGLVYEPIEQLSLYASYNQSFQPLSDALTVYRNLSGLQPTKTQSYEVGAKWDVTPDYNVSLSIFNTTQNNVLQSDPADKTGQTALVAGEQRSRGVEVTAVGQLTDKLSILAGYAYLDAKITKSVLASVPVGSLAALTPKNSANVWAKYQFNDHWYAAVGGRAQTSQYAASTNVLKLPGYAVMNAAVGYNHERYDVGLNVNNIFDRHYFVSAHGLSDQGALIGNPVNAQLTLRYRF